MVLLAGVFGGDGGKQLGVGLFNKDVTVKHGLAVLIRIRSVLGPTQYSGGGCPGERLKRE
jgi:hypothetical protein